VQAPHDYFDFIDSCRSLRTRLSSFSLLAVRLRIDRKLSAFLRFLSLSLRFSLSKTAVPASA